MKKSGNRRENTIVDFWQSATDLSMLLVFVLLLVVSLLMMYIFRLPEDQRFFIWGTEQNIQEYGDWAGRGDFDEGDGDDDDDDETDDSDGGGDGEEEDEFDEEYPLPSNGGEEWHKAAVYVTVIDAETLRAIRESRITFELYENFNELHRETDDNSGGAIRYLYTYYPEKVEFKNYETRDDGCFYLPEKILTGEYYFKELTAPEGYDSAETVAFTIDDTYEWADPYVVSVPLYPSKNVICAQLIDEDTGELITDGSFKVVAAENISTVDGTVRFSIGDNADFFDLDETGMGTSKELYLGRYKLSQSAAPKYYTVADNVVEVTVEKKGTDVPVNEFYCRKTEIIIRLSDDQSGRAISGVGYELRLDDGTVVSSGYTDSSGKLSFSNLEKNTVYTVKQTSTVSSYEIDDTSYSLYVDVSGYIGSTAKAELNLTNYIPRVEVKLQDILTHSTVSGKKLSLYDSADNLIHSWMSTDSTNVFTDIPEGSYYIVIGNDSNAKHGFTVTDGHKITDVTLETWSSRSTILVAVAVLVVPTIIYFSVFFAVKSARKRKKQTESND